MLLFAFLFLCAAAAHAQSTPAAELKPLWRTQAAHLFHDGLAADLGFSFSYDGRRVGPARPEGWTVSAQDAGRSVTLRHPSGLIITRTARPWPEAEAIEYTLTFKNESKTELPALSAVSAMDLTFAGDFVSGLSVFSSGGGTGDSFYPPRAYTLKRTFFGPMTPLDGQLQLTTVDGMPSRTNLPYYFVENRSKSAGLFVAVGWTGQWRAATQVNFERGQFRLTAGLSEMNLKLAPGEEISGPAMLLGCYRGPLAAGSNRLRRLIRERYDPLVGTKRIEAPVLYTTWFDIGAELDEKMFRSLVDRAAELGIEYFLMDAGWYKGTEYHAYTDMGGTWRKISNPLGNWELGEERSRFPSGLRVLADYVRSKGMHFGLWFEPERSSAVSLLAQKHPDWLIQPPPNDPALPGRLWRLVDFGKPEVQEYFCKILDRYIRELGLRYIRWDANLAQLPYWQSNDPRERRGITEIRQLEGVHRVEDWIRKNHPEVIIESCAGGGNRIDLATIRRRLTYWASDQTMDPLIVRYHLEGINHFLPGYRHMVAFSPPKSTYQKPGFEFPDIAFQSYFGGAFGAAGRLHEWPESLQRQARKHFDVYKKLRRFVGEDFYLLEPQSHHLDNWSGWQFHDPKANEGFVQAFRVHAPEPARRLKLQGLDAGSRYGFTDVYTGESFEATAAELLAKGLEFKLAPMTSRVLLYRRLP